MHADQNAYPSTVQAPFSHRASGGRRELGTKLVHGTWEKTKRIVRTLYYPTHILLIEQH